MGVAISEKPYGPFIPETEPIDGVSGIDPNPFIDEDGQAYLYWSAGNIYVSKLKDNMLELASGTQGHRKSSGERTQRRSLSIQKEWDLLFNLSTCGK